MLLLHTNDQINRFATDQPTGRELCCAWWAFAVGILSECPPSDNISALFAVTSVANGRRGCAVALLVRAPFAVRLRALLVLPLSHLKGERDGNG